MSFGAPLALAGLLALPLLAAWYRRTQRERQAAAAAFAAPAVQPSVAPTRPGWRRHVPMAIFLLAAAVLVVAAAQPQRTVAVPVERASVMLVTDQSGSMLATDVEPSRQVAGKRAAREFLDGVPAKVNVGIVAFNHTPRVLESPTRDRLAVRRAIDELTPSGGTATGDAISAATEVVRGNPDVSGKRPPAAIVLLSDGAATSGSDPVAAARAAGRLKIPVYTVSLGTSEGTIEVPRRNGRGTETKPVPPDRAALAQVARASGGRAFTAESASGLEQVYEKLGSQLGRRNEERQITSAFAGGGLVLLLAGVGMSLRWFGRMA